MSEQRAAAAAEGHARTRVEPCDEPGFVRAVFEQDGALVQYRVPVGSIDLPTGRAMGSHHSHHAGTTTWLTPPHIIEALGPFDLDPCGAPGWVTAAEHYILPQDGLALPWHGMVWLNPPYGSEVWKWLERLADHGNGIALIFARTETAGFVEQVWNKAQAVLFLHGRLHFHYPDGTRASANSGAPSCLVAYGVPAAKRLDDSHLPGSFVPLWRDTRDRSACIDRDCSVCRDGGPGSDQGQPGAVDLPVDLTIPPGESA